MNYPFADVQIPMQARRAEKVQSRNKTKMLKICFFQILIFSCFWESLLTASGGNFVITLDKIDNEPELSREYADWHIFLRRINKKEKVIDGYYTIKKDIHNPKALLSSYILSNNKFYKMAMNELIPTSLCDLKLKKDIVDPILVGNSSFSVPPDCVMRPGHMRLRKAESFDALTHRMINKTLYGTYKVVARVLNRENKTVGGMTLVLTAKKKD